MGSFDDISTWGLTDAEKAEVELMKKELTDNGTPVDEAVTIINGFIADCLEEFNE